MPTTRHRGRVLAGGRIEITDPGLREGAEAEVVVSLADPVPTGDSPDTPRPGGLPLVNEQGKPVFLPPVSLRRGRSLVDLIGLAPSGRTAEEVDREIRDFRGDDGDDR